MLETAIRAFFVNFSLVMLIAAVVAATICGTLHRAPSNDTFAHRLLRWTLLLSVGLQGIFTFIVHVFFPATSAENIGWAVSPFQFEVGIADLTVGVLGVIAFWSNFSFRVATVIASVCWYWGDAIGHIRQILIDHNYAPGNAGPWFWTDVLVPIVLIVCAIAVWHQQGTVAGVSDAD